MPPYEAPTLACRRSMPRWSSSATRIRAWSNALMVGNGSPGRGPRRAMAAAEEIDADDPVAVRVERTARADRLLPPTRRLRLQAEDVAAGRNAAERGHDRRTAGTGDAIGNLHARQFSAREERQRAGQRQLGLLPLVGSWNGERCISRGHWTEWTPRAAGLRLRQASRPHWRPTRGCHSPHPRDSRPGAALRQLICRRTRGPRGVGTFPGGLGPGVAPASKGQSLSRSR